MTEGGLLWRMLSAWADLGGAMRAELDRQPSEGRLLLYAMLSGVVWFLGEVMILRYGPVAPILSEDEFMGRAVAALGGALFVRTLALYGLAALGHLVARALGGSGGWRDSRAALFWAALVAGPAMLAAALLSLLLVDAPGGAGATAHMLGSLAFGWVAAQCFAEAHGFKGVWRGLMVVVGMAGLVLGTVYLVIAIV